jgi:hypothetical protein
MATRSRWLAAKPSLETCYYRRSAEAIGRHVEALLAGKIGGQPVPSDTAAWLANIGAALHNRLARAGLVYHREENAAALALGPFVDGVPCRP